MTNSNVHTGGGGGGGVGGGHSPQILVPQQSGKWGALGSLELTVGRGWLALRQAAKKRPRYPRSTARMLNAFGLAAVSRPWVAMKS